MSLPGLLGLLFLASQGFAADVQVIGYGAKTGINLEGITPLSPQLRAILAYTAMRAAGAGCPVFRDENDHTADDGQLHCDLTDALGLGYQCSPTHTGIVKQWFGKNLGALFDNNASFKYAMENDDLKWVCEATGNTASAQTSWRFLRLRTHADRVTVDGVIVSINRNDKVGIYANSWNEYNEYKIHADSVEVLRRVSTIIE